MADIGTEFQTFPSILEPGNPLCPTAVHAKRLITAFHTNQASVLKDRDELVQDLQLHQGALRVFEKQCHQSLKNLRIVEQMMASQIPMANELQAKIAQLNDEFQDLRDETTEMSNHYHQSADDMPYCRSIVEEWDAARFLLTEVNLYHSELQQRSPEMLHFLFDPQKVFDSDPKLRLKFGIADNVHSNGRGQQSAQRDIILTPSKLAIHKQKLPSIDNHNDPGQFNNNDQFYDQYGDTRGGQQRGQLFGPSGPNGLKTPHKRSHSDFKDNFNGPSGYSDDQNEQPPSLSLEQIELYRMDTMEKRNKVLGMQQQVVQSYSNEYSSLQQDLQQKMVMKQNKADRINELKARIAQRQQHLNLNLDLPANNSNGNAHHPRPTNNPSNQPSNSPKDHDHNQNQNQNQNKTRHTQLVLEKLDQRMEIYKAQSHFLAHSNHFDVDISSLDSHNFITFRFRSLTLPNGRLTPSGKLVVYRFQPGALVPPALTNPLAFIPSSNQPQVQTNSYTAPLDSFLISGAKLIIMEQDYSTKIEHLVQEAVQIQNLGLLVTEVQSLLAISTL